MKLGADLLAKDLCATVGVAAHATPTEIRRAYRRQVLGSHPDLNPTERERAERQTRDLNLERQTVCGASRLSRKMRPSRASSREQTRGFPEESGPSPGWGPRFFGISALAN